MPLPWFGIWSLCDFTRWTSSFFCWQDRILGTWSSLGFSCAWNPKEDCWNPTRCWEVTNRRPGYLTRMGVILSSSSAHFHSGQVLSIAEICSQLINDKSVIPFQSLFMTISVFLWISSINHFQHFCHSSICPYLRLCVPKFQLPVIYRGFQIMNGRFNFQKQLMHPKGAVLSCWGWSVALTFTANFLLYCRWVCAGWH